MKILFVANDISVFGGVERVLSNLTNALSENGGGISFVFLT